MTDHAGPQLSECNPGTKLWCPPAFVTQLNLADITLKNGINKRITYTNSGAMESCSAETFVRSVVMFGLSCVMPVRLCVRFVKICVIGMTLVRSSVIFSKSILKF